jgi:hypothetical protein
MSKVILVKTQAELDALPKSFDEFTYIHINSEKGNRILVVARGNSSVVARENSSVSARGNSSVVAWDNSSVEAWENSSVVARGNSSVVARENSSVSARGNSSVSAWDNSSVSARWNSSVVAWDNSSVEAWENSSVVARGNSSVVARENSSVSAWENSSVEAWGNCGVHVFSDTSRITIYMYAVVWLLAKAKIIKKSKTTTIIRPINKEGVDAWLECHGIKPNKNVTLYKRVSSEFKTQENTENETVWTIGKELNHPSWNPKESECGKGKYHACPKPYFADEFRKIKEDRYIAINIKKEDLYAWPNGEFPHKISFKGGKVLYECDRFGKEAKHV